MNKGWLELESDPGLFTLLLEDFGVKGIQVEEIYDLQKPIDGDVFGFIFLFRWIEERRCRRKTSTEDESCVMDDETVNSIFFAKQIIPNSCATHALLSVLLNSGMVKLGETLEKFKEFTSNMSPEDKGYAIGNMPELARAHNSHARPEPRHLPEKQPAISTTKTMEAFHFVSYVPIRGRLFELDGLKPYPIDHGPCKPNQYWTEKFRSVIIDRLGMATGGEPYHDVRFNLMAVVPCKRQLYECKLKTLKTNRHIVLEALQQMVKVTAPGLTAVERGTHFNHIDGIDKSAVDNARDKFFDTDKASSSKNDTLSNHNSKTESSELEEDEKRSDTSESTVRDQNVKIQISVKDSKDESITIPRTVSMTDVTKPLTIETKFSGSPGPSSESTDTASEVGSVFSSPGSFTIPSCQSSPQFPGDGDLKLDGDESAGRSDVSEVKTRSKHRFSSSQGFSPKDLLDLLKNVENEIEICEANLRDENEKRKKYKIDDCRRTHNYDQFMMTFLSMLAEQGHLANLVSQNVSVKKRQGANIGRLQPKPLSRNDKRRRARARRRR